MDELDRQAANKLDRIETAVADTFVQEAHLFADGFGERQTIFDAEGQEFDVLRMNATLSGIQAFESALRDRLSRIASFRHEAFSHVRAITTDKATGTLLIVSDHVAGVRLSSLLGAAEKRAVKLDLASAACLIRQLVGAAAAWRAQMPDMVHGAIGPDRIIVTPDGRLKLVEPVFGPALEQLHYSRQRFWEELAVPLPATFNLTINARADVLQVGAVALALLLGRRLNANDRLDEFPSALGTRITPAMRQWLSRALQLEHVGSFTSVLDAQTSLDLALGEADLVEEQDSLLLFMARCLALNADAGGGDAIAASDDLPDVDLATRIEALRAFLARRSARSSQAEPSTAGEAPPVQQVEEPSQQIEEHPPQTADPIPNPEHKRAPALLAFPLLHGLKRRFWLVAAATLAIAIAIGALVFTMLRSPQAPSTGKFSIDTRPAGIAVTIDGMPSGVTPLAIDLAAGDHLVELVTETDRRRIPVTIRAGSESSQFLEMGGAANTVTTSELRVRTEPLGAAVTVDGRYVGRSPVSVGDLAPGLHTVVMKHENGSATEQVLIEPGKAASLFVPLATAPPGGAAGWISISAPVDVQLFENGRFLGSSRIDRIMLPAGRHDLDIVNEALGFQERRVVQVTAGQVAPINLKWPTGRISINAVPWAQAFVDGALVGETPIANMQIPIGPHEIMFRHPQLGERRVSVTVTARDTAKVGVDLREK
jgi:PEGA domain-containing protein